MPAETPIREPRQVNLETEPYKFGDAPISADRALQTVISTFDVWSQARKASHDERWAANDRMYLGLAPKKYWLDGKTQRSSLGIPISFDQVESVYPIVTRSLFGRPDWVGAQPTPFSTPQAARALSAALSYQLGVPQDRSGTTALQQLKIAVKDVLIHGHGVIEVGFRPETGNSFVDWIPIKDFYFDPNMGKALIDHSTAVIVRKRMTVEQLQALRGQPGYNIPSDASLAFLVGTTPQSPTADLENHLKQLRRSQPNQGQRSPEPAHRFIEILQYWSNSRIIWVLNRKFVILNEENPYGLLPFCAAPCILLPGEAYGASMPDMLEGDQLLIQGITNASIDKLTLELFPPRYRQSQGGTHPMSDAWRPGMVSDIRDLKAVEVLFPPASGSDAFSHLGLADSRARKRFGVSELAQSGSPTASNANRTAGGVHSQEAATASRIGTIIENIEEYMIAPMLYKLQVVLNRFVPDALPQIPAEAQGQTGFVPRSILGEQVQFKLVGASSLAARGELLQIMQPVSQTLLSAPVLEMAAKQGQTLDFREWESFFLAATTGQRFAFFRPMNEQEQQAMQQPSPEAMAEIQKVEMEGAVRKDIMAAKIQGELQKETMKLDSKAEDRGENSSVKILELLMGADTERAKVLGALTKEGMKNAKTTNSGGGGSS